MERSEVIEIARAAAREAGAELIVVDATTAARKAGEVGGIRWCVSGAANLRVFVTPVAAFALPDTHEEPWVGNWWPSAGGYRIFGLTAEGELFAGVSDLPTPYRVGVDALNRTRVASNDERGSRFAPTQRSEYPDGWTGAPAEVAPEVNSASKMAEWAAEDAAEIAADNAAVEAAEASMVEITVEDGEGHSYTVKAVPSAARHVADFAGAWEYPVYFARELCNAAWCDVQPLGDGANAAEWLREFTTISEQLLVAAGFEQPEIQ